MRLPAFLASSRKGDVIAFFAIILSMLFLHLYFWKDVPSVIGTYYLSYFDTLQNHFWEYIFSTTLKPPLTYIIQNIVINIFGIESIQNDFIFQKVVIFLDLVGLCALFVSMRIARINTYIAAAAAIGFSAYLMPLEFWRQGLHYDHFSFFLNALFILGIALFARKVSVFSGIVLSVSGTLLLLQNTVFSLVVPATIVLTVFFVVVLRRTLVSGIVIATMLLMLPVSTTLAISYKNYLAAGIFAPSNLGGPALMLVSMASVGYDTERLRPLLDEAGVPGWYTWCYDNAVWDPAWGPMGAVNARSFGHCGEFIPFGEPGWLIDLSELRKVLVDLNAETAIASVDGDIEIMAERPYLLLGYAPELSLRWTDTYGKVSAKFFMYDLLHSPLRYLRTFAYLERRFNEDGTSSPYAVMYTPGSPLAVDKPGFYLVDRVIRLMTIAFYFSVFIVLSSALIGIVRGLFRLIRSRSQDVALCSRSYDVSVTLAGTTLILTFLYATIVGAENSRYFMYAAPYYMTSALALSAWWLGRKSERKASADD